MAVRPSPEARPTNAELEILTVLWRSGNSTVSTVYEVLTRRRGVRYTMRLKLRLKMTEKGLARCDKKQRADFYSARRPAEWIQQHLVGDLLQRAFGGSARRFNGGLCLGPASVEELTELRRQLEDHEKRML